MVWESRANGQSESPFEPRKQNFLPLPLGITILTPSHSTHQPSLCLLTRTNGNELLYTLSQTCLVGVGVGQGNAPGSETRTLTLLYTVYIYDGPGGSTSLPVWFDTPKNDDAVQCTVT